MSTDRPLRIAFCRISQESNAFSPVPSTLADFAGFHDLDADATLQRASRQAQEVDGFLKNAELSGFLRACDEDRSVVPIPLFSVWAVPSGPLQREAYDALRDRLLTALRTCGGFDAVYLCLHGALAVPGLPDPEADLIAAVRGLIGDRLLAVSLDLHAIVTPGLIDVPDLVVGYRTNPHRDHAGTGKRTGRLLIRALRTEVKPVMRWRWLPMALGGGTTIDFLPTMRPIYKAMNRMEKERGVLSVSLFQSHLFSDHRELGWATLAVTDGDPGRADALAEDLADRLWAVRDVEAPPFPDADEAIDQARSALLARTFGTVCMCDASDIVGAGAPGDNPRLLERLIARTADLRTYFPFRDADVVADLWDAPVGRRVDVELGGKLDPAANAAIGVSARVLGRDEIGVTGKRVLLGVGKLSIVVCAGSPIAVKPSFYTSIGLAPRRADITVVKSFFPFRLYFAAVNRKTIYAKTWGATDLDRVHDLDLARPTWPRDPVQEWRPADRERRQA